MFGFLSKFLRSRREARLRRERENEEATQCAKKRDYDRGYRDAVRDLSPVHYTKRGPERLSPEYFEGYKNGRRDHLAQTDRTGRLNNTAPARQAVPKSSAAASSTTTDTSADDLLLNPLSPLNPTRLAVDGQPFEPITRPMSDKDREALKDIIADEPSKGRDLLAAEQAAKHHATPSHSASSTDHSSSSRSHSHSSHSHSSHDSSSYSSHSHDSSSHSSSYDHGSSSYDSGSSSFDSGSSSSDSSSW